MAGIDNRVNKVVNMAISIRFVIVVTDVDFNRCIALNMVFPLCFSVVDIK